jgi:large subunit ribosomal protein L10
MRLEKKAIVDEIKGQLSGAGYVILADCRGMTVEQMKDLRAQLKGASAVLKVVPNALFGIAAKSAGWDGMEAFLQGPTAMVAGAGDVTKTAKLLRTYIKVANLPVLKGGRMGTRILQPGDVDAMALLPPREILLGQAVGTIAAPMTRFVGAMNQKLASLIYALKAVADKKTGGN